ncbi:MAG: hypothetical protein HY332_22140 [Chloroflexi bacterium]|nr:hypothetical protein [Chloroflexota bacterium]
MDTLHWDHGNLEHLDARNAARRAAGEREITREEIDALYDFADYTTRDVEYLTRDGWEIQTRLIGRTPGERFLTVACDILDDGRFRPVTVWVSSESEQRRYWQWKRNEKGDDDDDE